jgi:hypothetical protein
MDVTYLENQRARVMQILHGDWLAKLVGKVQSGCRINLAF